MEIANERGFSIARQVNSRVWIGTNVLEICLVIFMQSIQRCIRHRIQLILWILFRRNVNKKKKHRAQATNPVSISISISIYYSSALVEMLAKITNS